jgi:hypothetical protein
VIDCVLSLNRNYDRFVVPRLERFERDYHHVCSISDLNSEIGRYDAPDGFVRDTLCYRHPDRAVTLARVTAKLLAISEKGEAAAQPAKLKNWAANTPYGGHRAWGIRGFGLAGFQYLRMLFGANTTKPDIRIRQWVAKAVGHPVSDRQALQLLEAAAGEAAVSLRDADTTIWEMLARGSDGCA